MDDESTLERLRATLRDLLTMRFGPLPQSLSRRIDITSDFNRLRAALIQVIQMRRLDELKL